MRFPSPLSLFAGLPVPGEPRAPLSAAGAAGRERVPGAARPERARSRRHWLRCAALGRAPWALPAPPAGCGLRAPTCGLRPAGCALPAPSRASGAGKRGRAAAARRAGVAREVIEELTCRGDGGGQQQQLVEQQGWQEVGGPHGAGGPPRRLAGRRRGDGSSEGPRAPPVTRGGRVSRAFYCDDLSLLCD